MSKTIYLDAAAMHPALGCALEAYRTAPFGNPSSEHAAGQAARKALEEAREKIAGIMRCQPEEIIFTSTATEAAALVSYSLVKKGYGVASSPFEHHAVLRNACAFPFDDRAFAWPIDAFALMHSNNETGEIFFPPDVPEGSMYICDATASVGHVPVDFKELDCNYLIADGIKFGGVPGAAFLIYRNAPIVPLIRGGGQERGLRSGTENVPAICAMAAALEWQTAHMLENTVRLSNLSERMQYILSKVSGHKWNTPFDKPHLPHILNISFDGVDAHALSLLLSQEGIMISAGAACSNGKNEPSHVIMAMFGDEARARSAVRISLSCDNTEEEIEYASKKISEAVDYLRRLN